MQVIAEQGKVPIKMWTEGVKVEDTALQQIKNLATCPFVNSIAVMPDVHAGIGCTIGTVCATQSALVPSLVGVDIGCGMLAARLNMAEAEIKTPLAQVRAELERAVPMNAHASPDELALASWDNAEGTFPMHSFAAERGRALHQLGTLGSGNHFLELSVSDTDNSLWVVIHSGSRGIGNKIGTHYINRAKELAKRWYITLPDENLAFLPAGTDDFDEYKRDLAWAQAYAAENRQLMLYNAIDALVEVLGKPELCHVDEIECVHNYAAQEHHFGRDFYITRKGACRARPGERVIIPGSMGAKTYIAVGKGNAHSLTSCSHGAGRAMSRSEAKRTFTTADHAAATLGIECRKDAGILDESPGAYKDIDLVMGAQRDLVTPLDTLHQIVCVKGWRAFSLTFRTRLGGFLNRSIVSSGTLR